MSAFRTSVDRLSETTDVRPVVFFNASARLRHLSQNAAFSLLASYGLRLAGLEIVYFVCNSGMSRCVLGINPDDVTQPPPCSGCVAQSRRMFGMSGANWFGYESVEALRAEINDLSLDQLERFVYNGNPLGKIVLPGIRWALRRHNLEDTEEIRFLYRECILSAYNVYQKFDDFLVKVQPQAVVVFNGIMFPEAIARLVAMKKGLPVITHEVGLRPFTAFFTHGQATAYPLEIPADFALDEKQEKALDNYLEERFSGQFTMAGVRFWPKMQGLSEQLAKQTTQFNRFVPVFTNVIFDTSQVHANSIFSDMFAWLDEVAELIQGNPNTFFVIRAHPDEMRPGTRKLSRESVKQWVTDRGLDEMPNVAFINSDEYESSYELIRRAHFVMIYNSSIGLEASIMGKPVLSAGAARFTKFKTMYVPKSVDEYAQLAQQFLNADEIEQPKEFVIEARRVLYFQLFKTALPFDEFLMSHSRPGYVHLKSFPLSKLRPENSSAVRAIYRGVTEQTSFIL
jgi:hypothetical protein